MSNKLSVGALVVAIAALGVAYFAPEKVVIQPTKEVVREVVKELGAIPGTEVSGNEFTVGGLTVVKYRVPFLQATSSLCIVPKPHYATATLAFFGAVFNSGVATGTRGVDVSMSIES